MAILFEHIFKSNFKTYVRTFNSETKTSNIEEIAPRIDIYVENPNGEYKYFLDENIRLERKSFRTNKEYRDFSDKYSKLSNFKTYGKRQPEYEYIRENFFEKTEMPDSRIWYFDIEVGSPDGGGFPYPEQALGKITLFQWYDAIEKKFFAFGLKDLEKPIENTIYKKFKSEQEMIEGFCKAIHHFKPFVINGWNVKGFDFPYVTNRMKVLGMNENALSLVGDTTYREKEFNGRLEFDVEWKGIIFIDLMDNYKKFILKPQESYSLNAIARSELGDSKVDYGEFDSLDDLYERDYQKFVEYGVKDVNLCLQLDSKLQLINLQKGIAYSMGVTLNDALGTVKPWGQYLYNKAIERKLVLPNDSGKKSTKTIKGGLVLEPIVGKHEWLITTDWSSLYPTSIVCGNVSADVKVENIPPEFIPYLNQLTEDEDATVKLPQSYWDELNVLLEKYNYTVSAVGVLFDRSRQGLFAELIENMYLDRKKDKKVSQTSKNNAEKIKKILKERGVDVDKL